MTCRRILFALIALASAAPARAADDEVQIYLNDINPAGKFGLDVHVNNVLSGDGTPDYPGAQSSLHRLRITPEWSWSATENLEFGAYLPLMTLDSGGHFRADGAKLRVKWLPRHPEKGFYYGVNYEIGRVDHGLDRNPWNNEIKLIGGWEGDRWIVGGNLNFDWALSGPAKTPADVQLATRIGYKLGGKTVVGIESYNGLGTIRDFARPSRADQALFVSVDTAIGKWNLNAGIGKGYGTAKDDVIAKVIIGVPL